MIVDDFEIPTGWTPSGEEPSADALGEAGECSVCSVLRSLLRPRSSRSTCCATKSQPLPWRLRNQPTTHPPTDLLQELQENDALFLADEANFERALELAGCAAR